MKKIITLVAVMALFWLPAKAQTSLAVPYGSFEEWTTQPGYSVTLWGANIPIYEGYSIPTGWNCLAYPINESFSLWGNTIAINTNIPLLLAEEATTAVPAGTKAVELETFMLDTVLSQTAYALMLNAIDSTVSQAAFPSLLCNSSVNVDNFLTLVNMLLANMGGLESMLNQFSNVDLNTFFSGGMALGTFEPTRLTGSYKYASGVSGDNGSVVVLGTYYNASTHTRDVVGGGLSDPLTDIANYTPFTVDYHSMVEFDSTLTVPAPDSLIILIISSTSDSLQEGSTLTIDNLMLWHDTIPDDIDTCASIVNLTADPTVYDVVLSWGATGPVTGYELEYGPAGFALGTGNRVMIAGSPYTVQGLEGNTAYDVYLRTACSSTLYGDWDTLQFTTYPPCAFVASMVVSTTRQDSLVSRTLSWQGTSTPNFWEVEYGPQGFTLGEGTQLTTQDSLLDLYALELDGTLQPNTWYDFYVRSACDHNIYGDWDSVQYRTLCAPVEELTVSEDSLTVNEAYLLEGYGVSWVDNAGNQEWYVEYGPVDSADVWNVDTVQETSFRMPALVSSTQYHVSVVAGCGEGNYSIPRVTTFTTQFVGIEETEALSLSVYPNPADGRCRISLSSGEPAELKLFSLDGRLLQTLHTTGTSVELQLPAAGLYLLQATTPSGTTTRKITSK